MIQPFLLRRSFTDFDEFTAAARGWDVEWRQLDPGRFKSDLVQLAVREAILGWASASRRLEQRGASPAGLVTFVIPGTRTAFVWRGHHISPWDIMVSGPLSDFESISPPGWSIFTLSLPLERLNRELAESGIAASGVSLIRGEVVRSTRPVVDRLRRVLRRIRSTVESAHGILGAEANGWMERDVLGALANAIAAGAVNRVQPHGGLQPNVLQSAKAMIGESLDQPPTVTELCQSLGVGSSTLYKVFREQVGISPQSYIKAQRLNGARSLLKKARPGTLVAQVANQMGFWHMGQFAADYRRQFGELPSKTLASNWGGSP